MVEEEGVQKNDALDKIGAKRYCCRRMFLTYVDTYKYISEFNKQNYFFIHEDIKEVKDVQPVKVDGVDVSDQDSDDDEVLDLDNVIGRMSINDDIDIEMDDDDD
jgi:hypothetical protein